jgi:hypothetical protein
MSTHRLWLSAGIGALIAMAGVWPVAAQVPTYGVGRPPTAEEVQAWDLTIPPDGQGLPPGSGTAALGHPNSIVSGQPRVGGVRQSYTAEVSKDL